MKKYYLLYFCLIFLNRPVFPQGSWNPPGFDPVFPRTLLDSTAINTVRNSLADPDHLFLYGSIWLNANSAIPAGNSTITDRYTRAVIAKESAFIFLMDRRFSANTIIPLTPIERDTMRNRTIRLLEQMNTDVDVGTFWTFYNPWQHRSKELISCLIAYDLMKGSGVSQTLLDNSKSKLLTFTANLYQKSMASYVFNTLKFFTYQYNNHSIMTASALGLAAVVFNDNTSTNVNYQPQNWINAGLYNIDNTLWVENGIYPRVSEPDTLAGYAEGPNYFKYCFENAFPFIRAMGNFLPDGYYSATFNSATRNIRNPWFDIRYDRIYDWLNKTRMPDGSFPAIHDSYLGFGTVMMALSGKPQYNWLNPGFTADDPAVRTQYIATNVAHGPIQDSLFQSLPAAGSLVFRSSWETSAVYMHFIGKHGIALSGAKSHHQADASSFSLAAYGELLAVDPGYPGASQAELENKAIDHSLILVNGSGPLTPTGESVSISTNTSYIEHCFDTPLLDYGEVRTTYQGADIIRKNLFVRNKYFILSDFLSSSSQKNYTFQLHGNGFFGSAPTAATGAFIPDFGNSQGVYTRNSVSLLARITTPGTIPTFSYELDSMVIAGGFRRYSKMLAQKNASTNTLFLSTLFPYTLVPPQIVTGSHNSTITSFRITSNGFKDLIFCSYTGILHTIHPDSTGMNKVVKGNGKVNFLSEASDGVFASAFLQAGDSIAAGTQIIIQTNKKLDVAWMGPIQDLCFGYVSDFGVVKFYAAERLQHLAGPVSSVSFDSLKHLTMITFLSKGNFILGPADLTWIWTGNADGNWHNPANWQMQGHATIHGVPVETNNVIIPAGLANMPVISSQNPATCHDLTIQPDASITIELQKLLTVTGTLTIEHQ